MLMIVFLQFEMLVFYCESPDRKRHSAVPHLRFVSESSSPADLQTSAQLGETTPDCMVENRFIF